MTRLISVYNAGPKGEALRHIPNSQVSQIMQNTNVHSLAVQIFASVDQNFKSSQEEIIARMQWNTDDKYFMIRKALEKLRGVDELINSTWRGERIGYLHLDVEGGELAALQGSTLTIQRE